jgi:IS5 family transposase
VIGYDGFKKVLGTKIHVAVDNNGLPVSIVLGPTNNHDATRFVDVMESISDYLDEDMIKQIVAVYADSGYDSKSIREYLKNRSIKDCIPYRNYKTIHNNNKKTNQKNNFNKTRYVVEPFFA